MASRLPATARVLPNRIVPTYIKAVPLRAAAGPASAARTASLRLMSLVSLDGTRYASRRRRRVVHGLKAMRREEVVTGGPRCYPPSVGDEGLERILAWIVSVVAIGLLGAGAYAVFNSTNGSGAVALLTIGGLALFVVVFGDRIRSMKFGAAQIQLALKVKYSLKNAFKLRLSGNYEEAETEIEFAFDQFVRQESSKVQRAYLESKVYQEKVLFLLSDYVEKKFDGQVRETASTVSFLPLMDAVMTVDGNRYLAELASHNKPLCANLTERVKKDKYLRTAVIVRPGPSLDVAKLVERLEEEVKHGALGVDCFLLIQNCKDSDSRKEFCKLVSGRGMHAKSLVWQPVSGSELLRDAFLAAILTICNPNECGVSRAAGLTRPNSASPIAVTID